MSFENLTPEQQEKARACKTPEDIVALARQEGYDLSDEELEVVAGGAWCVAEGCGEFSLSAPD